MKERPNLNELAKEIHNDNKLKGFHDVDWSDEHCLCLVISELMEAVEADRKGRKANIDYFHEIDNNGYAYYLTSPRTDYASNFEQNVKDTIEDKLADAVIRLLDLAGVRGWDVIVHDDYVIKAMMFNKNRTFTENVYNIIRFTMAHEDNIMMIKWTIAYIEAICQHLSIDLWLHIDLKLKYNKTRPYKHGKEY